MTDFESPNMPVSLKITLGAVLRLSCNAAQRRSREKFEELAQRQSEFRDERRAA